MTTRLYSKDVHRYYTLTNVINPNIIIGSTAFVPPNAYCQYYLYPTWNSFRSIGYPALLRCTYRTINIRTPLEIRTPKISEKFWETTFPRISDFKNREMTLPLNRRRREKF